MAKKKLKLEALRAGIVLEQLGRHVTIRLSFRDEVEAATFLTLAAETIPEDQTVNAAGIIGGIMFGELSDPRNSVR